MYLSPKLQPTEYNELNIQSSQNDIFQFQLIQDYFQSLSLKEKEKVLTIDNQEIIKFFSYYISECDNLLEINDQMIENLIFDKDYKLILEIQDVQKMGSVFENKTYNEISNSLAVIICHEYPIINIDESDLIYYISNLTKIKKKGSLLKIKPKYFDSFFANMQQLFGGSFCNGQKILLRKNVFKEFFFEVVETKQLNRISKQKLHENYFYVLYSICMLFENRILQNYKKFESKQTIKQKIPSQEIQKQDNISHNNDHKHIESISENSTDSSSLNIQQKMSMFQQIYIQPLFERFYLDNYLLKLDVISDLFKPQDTDIHYYDIEDLEILRCMKQNKPQYLKKQPTQFSRKIELSELNNLFQTPYQIPYSQNMLQDFLNFQNFSNFYNSGNHYYKRMAPNTKDKPYKEVDKFSRKFSQSDQRCDKKITKYSQNSQNGYKQDLNTSIIEI